MRRMVQSGHDQRGVGFVELLVALAVFALFFLLIDTVFIGTHRSTRKAELAADVQQNARIAIERLTREIRESRFTEIRIAGTAPAMAVAFRSARLDLTPETFCLYVRTTTDPNYNSACFYGSLATNGPPYASPPSPPYGTYAPIWQRYIGFWTEALGDGSYRLRRTSVNLTTPSDPLPDPSTFSCPGVNCGEVIATYVQNFTVSLTGTNFSVILDAQGRRIVQGTPVPTQEVLLNGTTLIRN